MYFITGGRGSQSGLYRVRYVGSQAEAAHDEALPQIESAAAARQLRHDLEYFHTHQDPRAVELAWPQLGSSDVWLRHAARIAIERQDVATWRDRAPAERDPATAITALLALARAGTSADQAALLSALEALPLATLDQEQLLGRLRVYALTFIRQGRPNDASRRAIADRLDSIYPHASSIVNQELCELLVYLQAPNVIPKTLALLASAATQEEQIQYALLLTQVADGWDIQSRGRMLAWLKQAQKFPGGKLVDATVKNLQADYSASLTREQREQLAEAIAALDAPAPDEPLLPPRPFVRRWQPEDLVSELPRTKSGRSRASARTALAAGLCLRCHRIGNEGGRVGPDLTSIGKRFDDRALLESILEPSKVIDPKYRHTAYELDNGKVVHGRTIGVNAQQLVIETDPLTAATVTIDRDAIEASHPAEVSPMPNGLMDTLSADEILDLLAYLRSASDVQSPAFQ
ncbi:MAG: c-type cytochrome [Planctomycetia bacterium]|nr:c-type cytochrome [Planctomycetia bacterium]